jgi:hypothetical protein
MTPMARVYDEVIGADEAKLRGPMTPMTRPDARIRVPQKIPGPNPVPMTRMMRNRFSNPFPINKCSAVKSAAEDAHVEPMSPMTRVYIGAIGFASLGPMTRVFDASSAPVRKPA